MILLHFGENQIRDNDRGRNHNSNQST